ncbi:hypothetical protein F5887DRAFT_951439 [Amanita rubescens]|nr:hypothetical protein F5887DRAFT_951439 [Amanita rubescens]
MSKCLRARTTATQALSTCQLELCFLFLSQCMTVLNHRSTSFSVPRFVVHIKSWQVPAHMIPNLLLTSRNGGTGKMRNYQRVGHTAWTPNLTYKSKHSFLSRLDATDLNMLSYL